MLDDGRLRCWGAEHWPEPLEGSPDMGFVPKLDRGVTNIRQVSVGSSKLCVRYTDDTLDCQTGFAGNGTQDVVDVESGFFRTSAWLRDGTVLNWNINGEMVTWGNGFPSIPAQTRIKRVSSGYQHVCALADSGRVYCFAAVEHEGGDGHVRGISDAIDISAGFEHTCALLRDRTVRCWGRNHRGQLGDGTRDDRMLPVAVVGESHVTQVECGRDHSCTRHEDGSISCWGSNEFGQLGDGSWNDSNTPVRVLGIQ